MGRPRGGEISGPSLESRAGFRQVGKRNKATQVKRQAGQWENPSLIKGKVGFTVFKGMELTERQGRPRPWKAWGAEPRRRNVTLHSSLRRDVNTHGVLGATVGRRWGCKCEMTVFEEGERCEETKGRKSSD